MASRGMRGACCSRHRSTIAGYTLSTSTRGRRTAERSTSVQGSTAAVMPGRGRYVYGPVPSRRLGRSLGVDLVAYKTCTYDCIYCQLGRTRHRTARRTVLAPAEEVLAQVQRSLIRNPLPDYVTLTGAGEPTLHSQLGLIVSELKRMSPVPVAVLTSGALLVEPEVREACSLADVVMPTFTTVQRRLFHQIHRPVHGITPGTVLEGLIEFRRVYRGEIWLEVMLLQRINSGDEQVEQLRRVVGAIGPDRVQLNTVVRPPADLGARRVGHRRMAQVCRFLGSKAEVIADYTGNLVARSSAVDPDEVLALLSRRPCQVLDVAAGLSMAPNQVVKLLTRLEREGRITSRRVQSRRFYQTQGQPSALGHGESSKTT